MFYSVSINGYSQVPQIPPCSLPCEPPNQYWIYVIDYQVPLPGWICPTCTLEIQYWFRECGEEIQIALGSIHQTGDCTLCESWLTWFAADYIAKNNSMIRMQLYGNWGGLGTRYCFDEYKFTMVTCYEWVPGDGGFGTNEGGWHSEPCNSTDCCTYDMEICVNEDGRIESAYQLQSVPIECVGECYNQCGFYSDYYEKSGVNATSEMVEVLNPEFIIPNPNNGNFKIEFKNTIKGDYVITICDILGNTIFSEKIYVDSRDYQQKISLDKCNSGTYIYNIMLDNQIYQTGKINIIK